jgi:hypothetical protein
VQICESQNIDESNNDINTRDSLEGKYQQNIDESVQHLFPQVPIHLQPFQILLPPRIRFSSRFSRKSLSNIEACRNVFKREYVYMYSYFLF